MNMIKEKSKKIEKIAARKIAPESLLFLITMLALLFLLLIIPKELAAQGQKERKESYPAKRIDMQQAELTAERNNRELKALMLEKQIAKEQSRSRLRNFFPALSLSYRRNRSIVQRGLDSQSNTLQLNISQPIYDGGRAHLAWQIAQIDQRLANRRYTTYKDELRLQVREAYMQVLLSRENIAIYQAALKSARENEKKASVEKQLGVITDLDHKEISLELKRRELALENVRQELDKSVEDIKFLLRFEPQEKIILLPLSRYRLTIREPAPREDQFYEKAVRTLPEMESARAQLLRAHREYYIEKYNWLPTLSLAGNWGRSGESWPPRQVEWGVGLSFTFRLWGNSLNNDLHVSRANAETSQTVSSGGQFNFYDQPEWYESQLKRKLELLKSQENRRSLQYTLKAEILERQNRFRLQYREIQLDLRSLELSNRRFLVERLRFQQGNISARELIDSELRYIEERLTLARRFVDLIISANQLELRLGLPLDSLQLAVYEKNHEYLPESQAEEQQERQREEQETTTENQETITENREGDDDPLGLRMHKFLDKDSLESDK